jgi:predicted RNA-binding Zn-ribbon protein involved in translation (DUF1610 family)
VTSAGFKVCTSCKELIKDAQKSRPRNCIVCGAALGREYKYCQKHKPKTAKIDPILNRRTSIAWQKNNPEKVRASYFARYRPDQLYVLYECPCEHSSKHHHHFSYELKNIVIRLCPNCHSKEHVRLRSFAAQAEEISRTTAISDYKPRPVVEAGSASI